MGSLSLSAQKAIEIQFDDGSSHKVLMENVDSILYEPVGDNLYKQTVFTPAFIFESSVTSSSRLEIKDAGWPEAVLFTEETGEWSEILAQSDGTLMGLKKSWDTGKYEEMLLISPKDTLFCHIMFDENEMPRKIYINDGYYLVNSYTDTSINLTLVLGDSKFYPLGDIPVDLSSASRVLTRGWKEMTIKSRCVTVFKALAGITITAIAGTTAVLTVAAGATAATTVVVVGGAAYTIFSGGKHVYDAAARAFDFRTKAEDTPSMTAAVAKSTAQEIAETTVEDIVKEAAKNKTWKVWDIIKTQKLKLIKGLDFSSVLDIMADVAELTINPDEKRQELLNTYASIKTSEYLLEDDMMLLATKGAVKGKINEKLLQLHGVGQNGTIKIDLWAGNKNVTVNYWDLNGLQTYYGIITGLKSDTRYDAALYLQNNTYLTELYLYRDKFEHGNTAVRTMLIKTGKAESDKSDISLVTIHGSLKGTDGLKNRSDCYAGVQFSTKREDLDVLNETGNIYVDLKDGDFEVTLAGLDRTRTYYYCTYVYSQDYVLYDRGEICAIPPEGVPRIISCKMGEEQASTDGFILKNVLAEAAYECKEGEVGWGISLVATIDGEPNLVGMSEVIPSSQKEAIRPKMSFAGAMDHFDMDYDTFTATWNSGPIQVVPFIDVEENGETKRKFLFDAAIQLDDEIIYQQAPMLAFRDPVITDIEQDDSTARTHYEATYGLLGAFWLERIKLMNSGSDFYSADGGWALDDFMDGLSTLHGVLNVTGYNEPWMILMDLNLTQYMRLYLCNGTTRNSENGLKFSNNGRYVTGVEVVNLSGNLLNSSARAVVSFDGKEVDDLSVWQTYERTVDFMKSSSELFKDIKENKQLKFGNR